MAKNLKIHVKLAHAQDKYVSFNMKILVNILGAFYMEILPLDPEIQLDFEYYT